MNKAIKTVSFIVVATFLSKVLGLLRDVFIANYYGTSTEATAFLNASSIPVLFFDLTLGAAILSSFIPVFNGYLKNGEKEKAFEFSNSFINLIFVITFVFTIIGAICSSFLVELIAPGVTAEAKILTIKLLVILLPTTIFTGLAFCIVGILQSFDEFNIPAIISLVSNIVVILYLLLFNSKFGIFGLAVAMLIGWSLQLFIQLPSLIKKGYKYSFKLKIENEGIKSVIKLSLPILIGSWLQPVTVLINKHFASYLNNGSAASALDYSNRLFIIIVGVFAFAITNYIFPAVSKLDIDRNKDEFADIMKGSIKAIILIIAPIFTGMMLLSTEIISVIYGRGEFNELSIRLSSTALFFYSIGMISYGINEIINKCFYALKKAYIPMIAAVSGILTTIVISSLHMKTPYAGIGGLALSSSIGLMVVTLVLCIYVKKQFKGFFDRNLLVSVGKSAFSTAIMVAIGIFVRNATVSYGVYICIGATVLACAIVYFAAQLIMKNEELLSVIKLKK